MKKWKNRLLPIFTCLVVLGAALLPQRLSELRDHTLMGTVHTEKLTDNWLLARPLSLAERIELLALWADEPERFTVVTHELSVKMAPEEILALQTQVWKELKSLADAGIFPDEMLQEETSDLSGERTSVRLSDDLRSTTFLRLDRLDKRSGMHLSIFMDADTGHAVAMQAFCPTSVRSSATASDIGKAFLDRLDLDNQVQTSCANRAVLLLPETDIQYVVDLDYSNVDGYLFLVIEPVNSQDWLAREFGSNQDSAG